MLNSSFPLVGIIKHRRFSGFLTDTIACLHTARYRFLYESLYQTIHFVWKQARILRWFPFEVDMDHGNFCWRFSIFVYMFEVLSETVLRIFAWNSIFLQLVHGGAVFSRRHLVRSPYKGCELTYRCVKIPSESVLRRHQLQKKYVPRLKIHNFLKTFSYIFGIIDTKIPGTFYYILRLAVLSAG